MTTQRKPSTIPIAQNLLLQAIAYFKRHDDPMAKMLSDQFRFAIAQEEAVTEETKLLSSRD